MSNIDVSVIATFHDEDFLVGATISSLLECVEKAELAGITVEVVFTLDFPTPTTKRIVEHHAGSIGCSVYEFEYGDQGLVRNSSVGKTSGRYVAFLDGDDLFGFDWIRVACELLDFKKGGVVHPELNVFFEGRNSIFLHRGSDDELFDLDYFRVGNYWDAMCMAERSILLEYPYRPRDIALGFAYEDWDWNMRTLAGGVTHYVAVDTVHFKRSRKRSQSKVSRDRGVVYHLNEMSNYDSYSDTRVVESTGEYT
jgi:glycosyltransferase involved in cell wall biosynthesis